MDPITLITTISTGLKLVDQFRELALRIMGKKVQPPSAKAEQDDTALVISHEGKPYKKVEAATLKMNEFDEVQFNALNTRILTQWRIFYDLFTSEAGSSAMEGARIREDMRKTKEKLCKDFREMVQLYERALGESLPDHYQLYEVCGT